MAAPPGNVQTHSLILTTALFWRMIMHIIWFMEKETGSFHKIEVMHLDTAQLLWDTLLSVDTVILRSTRP